MNEALHPFRWLPWRERKIVFLISLGVTLLSMGALWKLGQGLVACHAPAGILSFEFAGELETVLAIFECWGERGRLLAGFHLGLDYLFLVCYPCSIALGCAFALRQIAPKHSTLLLLGAMIAWGQLLAGLLDAVENSALICLLFGIHKTQLSRVAWWCAAGKFSLVGAGLGFLLLASVPALVARAWKA